MSKPKPTPDSQWDDIPGFDRKLEQYVRLDADAWLRDHNICEIAAKRGLQNQPTTAQQQPDAMYQKIPAWVNQRGLRCRHDINDHIADAVAELNDIEDQEGLEVQKNRVTEIRDNTEIDIENCRLRDCGILYELRKALTEETKDFEKFRKRANLTRMAVYPTNFFQKWWLVIACAMVEVLFNAFVLADVTPTGFLGAISLMGLITAVNILVGALLVGSLLLRAGHHINATIKAVSWVSLLVVMVGILIFNLGVGHLRDSMIGIQQAQLSDPFEVLRNDAWARLASNHLHYESFQSGLLVIVGLLFFSIAMWKGYRSDDFYPGYGKKDRHLRQLNRRYRGKLEEARSAIDAERLNAINELNDLRHEMETKKAQWRTTVDRIERIVTDYPAHLRQYQNDLDTLLTAYCTANRETRTEPEPGFFDKPMSIDPYILTAPKFEPPEESSQKDLADHIHQAIQNVQTLYAEALEQYSSLEDISAEGFTGEDTA